MWKVLGFLSLLSIPIANKVIPHGISPHKNLVAFSAWLTVKESGMGRDAGHGLFSD